VIVVAYMQLDSTNFERTKGLRNAVDDDVDVVYTVDLVDDVVLPPFDTTGLYTPAEFDVLRLTLYGVTYQNGPKTRIATGKTHTRGVIR